ncbi:MAG: tyrosine-type recombinase/integrase [Sutterella sp.]|nr:tyrosine-type recombinase/integrase [Sutterella sp.]
MKSEDIALLPDGLHRADRCLYIEVDDPVRRWLFISVRHGKRFMKNLGNCCDVRFEEARREALLQLRAYEYEVEYGGDFVPSLKFAADEAFRFLIETSSIRNVRQARNTWNTALRRHWLPGLASVPFNRIGEEEIFKAIGDNWVKHPGSSQEYLRVLKLIIDFGRSVGWYSGSNPARWRGRMEHYLPSVNSLRRPVYDSTMSVEQVKRTLEVCRETSKPAERVVVFTILTCQKVQECLRAEWPDIDFKARTWKIPGIKRHDKKRDDFIVPLSTAALKFLRPLRQKEGLVFESRLKPGVPVGLSGCMSALKIGAKDGTARFNAIKKCFSRWASEKGFDPYAAPFVMMGEVDRSIKDIEDKCYPPEKKEALKRRVLEEWGKALTLAE